MDTYLNFYLHHWNSIKEIFIKYLDKSESFNVVSNDFEQKQIKQGYSLTNKYSKVKHCKQYEEYKEFDYNSEEFKNIIDSLNFVLQNDDKNDIYTFNSSNIREAKNLYINSGYKLSREKISKTLKNLHTEEWCTVYRKQENKYPLLFIVNKLWSNNQRTFYKFEVKYENIQQQKTLTITGVEYKNSREIDIKVEEDGGTTLDNYKEDLHDLFKEQKVIKDVLIKPSRQAKALALAEEKRVIIDVSDLIDVNEKTENLELDLQDKFSDKNIKKKVRITDFKKKEKKFFETYTLDYDNGIQENAQGHKGNLDLKDGTTFEYREHWNESKNGEKKIVKQDIIKNDHYCNKKDDTLIINPADNKDLKEQKECSNYKKEYSYEEESGERL